VLERRGIRCNLTLIFGMAQAIACADAGVTLISPFVGRILDWHMKNTGQTYSAEEDPGVQSVRAIYRHYRRHGYPTIVMGASFRNHQEVEALCGCDRLTVGPAILKQLSESEGEVPRRLDPAAIEPAPSRPAPLSEAEFRWRLNDDAMATEKLAEGIRLFDRDAQQLRAFVKEFAAKRGAD
jgi:transaldolase